MEKTISENPTQADDNLATRTKEIIFLYRSFIELSTGRLNDMKNTLFDKKHEPVWKKLLDLRILGLIFIIIAFTLKVMQKKYCINILEPIEFITVFMVGTILIILGTYFNIKDVQEDRKLIAKENETIANTFTACTGLMQRNM